MNDTNSTGQPAALPGLAVAAGSESGAIAARIPWRFVLHMSGDREHALMHRNEELNLQCETITKYRHGVPGKALPVRDCAPYSPDAWIAGRLRPCSWKSMP